jgi:hypothetical protein
VGKVFINLVPGLLITHGMVINILLPKITHSQVHHIPLKQILSHTVRYAKSMGIMLSSAGIGLITVIRMIMFHKLLLHYI